MRLSSGALHVFDTRLTMKVVAVDRSREASVSLWMTDSVSKLLHSRFAPLETLVFVAEQSTMEKLLDAGTHGLRRLAERVAERSHSVHTPDGYRATSLTVSYESEGLGMRGGDQEMGRMLDVGRGHEHWHGPGQSLRSGEHRIGPNYAGGWRQSARAEDASRLQPGMDSYVERASMRPGLPFEGGSYNHRPGPLFGSAFGREAGRTHFRSYGEDGRQIRSELYDPVSPAGRPGHAPSGRYSSPFWRSAANDG